MNATFRLGNDVVDLSQPQYCDKQLDQRFLNRVFSPKEREAIAQAKDPNTLIWQIWAAKEAAFKALQKEIFPLVFSHCKFEVTPDTLGRLSQNVLPLKGFLVYENYTVALSFEAPDRDCLHCIGVLSHEQDPWASLQIKLKKHEAPLPPKVQSQENRKLAARLFEALGLPVQTEIVRHTIEEKRLGNQTPPVLMADGAILPYEISLSHDGHWGAIVLAYRPLSHNNNAELESQPS